MRLKDLLDSMMTNPKIITSIENEVERIVEKENVDYLMESFKIEDANLRFYLLIVLEKKMRLLKDNNCSFNEIVNFTEYILLNYEFKGIDQKKLSKIYALIDLYEWPNNYFNFFNILSEFIRNDKKIGYLILENFLYLMHNSIEINEERRNELKRAMVVLKDNLISLITNCTFNEEIILIYTHLISILPKPVDFTIIFEKGMNFLDKSLDFFLEAISSKYNDFSFFANLIKFSESINTEAKMIECLLNMKEHIYIKNIQLYSYVFKGLSQNIYTFSLSLQFFVILFRKPLQAEFYVSLATEVLQEIIRVIVTYQENDITSIKLEDLESDVVTLLGLISQNYQSANHLFLTKFINDIPRKYAVILLKANKNKGSLPLTTTYFKGLAFYLDNNPSCIDLLMQFDFNDKDSCKLIGQIVKKFCNDREKLMNLLNILKNYEHTEESVANIILKLRNPSLVKQVLEGEFNLKKSHILFYFLKCEPSVVPENLDNFYLYFINNTSFDRSFSIISLIYKHFSVPKEIWEAIYNSIELYSLKDINYFCTDLLQKLNEEIQIPFIEKIFYRLTHEWSELEDEIELSLTTKSFLTVLEGLIIKNHKQHNEIQYTNLLIEFLKYNDPSVLIKIYSFYSRIKFSFDNERMVYFLLMCYNSYEMVDCQNEIISLLIECMGKQDGPITFQKFNFNAEETCKISELLKNASTKRGRALVKNLLSDIKGKPLSNLYEPINRIQSQNIFNKNVKENNDNNDFVFNNF